MNDTYITEYEALSPYSTVVTARTPAGEVVRVVIPTVRVGTAEMWQALRAAASQTDSRAAALAARKGRTDSEGT